VEGVIGGSTQLEAGRGQADDAGVHRAAHHQRGELRRPHKAGGGTDVRKVDLRRPSSRAWAQATRRHRKELRNVGPSVGYKLRDASGQAREFQNYMLPVDMGDGQPVFLLGVRETRPSLPLSARAGR
jgi:cytochrome c biogenesis protein